MSLEGGAPLALARFLSTAGMLSCFGALAFRPLVADPVLQAADRARFPRPWRLLVAGSLLIGLTGGLCWLAIEIVGFTGAADLPEFLAALPVVLGQTRFGTVLSVRLGLLLAGGGAGLLGWSRIGTLLVGAAVITQAWHGHAMSIVGLPPFVPAAEILHLLAAGLWAGQIAPLALLIGIAPARAGDASWRFARAALPAAWLLAFTGPLQGMVLAGGIAGLLHMPYGWAVWAKTVLFLALLASAWHNRRHLVPGLARGGAPAGGRLRRALGLQILLVLLLLAAATILALLPPGLDQPS